MKKFLVKDGKEVVVLGAKSVDEYFTDVIVMNE